MLRSSERADRSRSETGHSARAVVELEAGPDCGEATVKRTVSVRLARGDRQEDSGQSPPALSLAAGQSATVEVSVPS